MGRIVDLTEHLVRQYDLSDPLDMLRRGLKPDFRLYTAGLETVRTSQGEVTDVVRMVGSSTEEDMQGDTMDILALRDMTTIPDNMTVWLNHKYDVPEDVFGSILERPMIVQKAGVADLHLLAGVEMDNPRAAKVKRFIDNGRRFGCSIGCIVTKYEVADEASDGPDYYKQPIRILGVLTMEFSVVGIPANQRSWVENAVRGLFLRTLDPALAPAMKSLWPSVYQKALELIPVEHAQKRAELEAMPMRPTTGGRVDWNPQKRQYSFVKKDYNIPISPAMLDSAMVDALRDLDDEGLDDLQLDYEPETVKGACGKTSWPLADKGHGWDGPAAKKRLNAWAGDNKGKLKQVYFWTDGQDHFKLPFCDVIGGSIKAVPHAIHAVAGSFGGSRSGLNVPDADKQAIRRKVAVYYRKMGETPPWEQSDDDKAFTSEVYMTEEGEILSTMGKKMFAINADGTQGIEIKASGDHMVMTGSHTHIHKAFGGPGADMEDNHGHSHEHVNDALHQHDHITAAMPQNADRDGDGDIDTQGSQGGPGHDSAPYNPASRPAGQLSAHPSAQKGSGHVHTLDAGQASILSAVNGLLKQLGLPDLTAENVVHKTLTKANGDVPFDDGNVHSVHLQTIHDAVVTHAAVNHGMTLCAGSQSNSDMNFQQARDQADMAAGNDVSGRRNSIDSIERLIKALDGFETKGVHMDMQALNGALAGLKKESAAILAEYKQANENLAALKNVPLGNPIHQNRTVTPVDGQATRQDFLGITNSQRGVDLTDGETVIDAIRKGTEKLELAQGAMRITVRRWPTGFGGTTAKGFRPALTTDQIMLMRWNDIEAYNNGEAADVPCVDDPVDRQTSLSLI